MLPGGRGASWLLKWREGGANQWVRVEGWLRWSAHPLGGALCRDHTQYPAFAPSTSEVAVGFWPFCILLFIIFPNCACMQLSLVPYSFFIFCCSRRCLPRCKHSSKGSQIPVCLIPKVTSVSGQQRETECTCSIHISHRVLLSLAGIPGFSKTSGGCSYSGREQSLCSPAVPTQMACSDDSLLEGAAPPHFTALPVFPDISHSAQ